jgi:hypothetical protein
VEFSVDRNGFKFDVQGTVGVDESDTNSIPVVFPTALTDHVNNLHFAIFHGFFSLVLGAKASALPRSMGAIARSMPGKKRRNLRHFTVV